MDKSNSLHRSDTFPYDEEQANDMHQHFIETAEGWYSVILEEDSDNFILTTPKSLQIEDSLTEIHKRKGLYHFEDGMIYEWLKMIQDKTDRHRTAMGETRTWFKIDGVKYTMRIDTKLGKVWLSIPAQTRVFTVKSMYLENNSDLPLIQDGMLDDEVRKRLQRKGLELPRVPYKVGLGISTKIMNASDEGTN